MTLLPRSAKAVMILAALVTLVALPVVWTQQAPWHGIAPALSHAGGSPDETLGPRRTGSVIRDGKSALPTRPASGTVRATSLTPLGSPPTSHIRTESSAWLLYERLYLTALLRF
jgi:hypothetical protein